MIGTKLLKAIWNDTVFSDPEWNNWNMGPSLPIRDGRNKNISDCFDLGKIEYTQFDGSKYNHEEYIAWRKSMSITRKKDENNN